MPLVRVTCSNLVKSPAAWKKCRAAAQGIGLATPEGYTAEMTVEAALALIIELLAQPAPKPCCRPKRPWVPPPGFAPPYALTSAGGRKGC